MRTIATVLTVLSLSACMPVFADCFVPQLAVPDSSVAVVHRPESAECYRLWGSLPGEYTLVRPQYTLNISTGDRWYPMLWLRATRPGGERLRVEGDSIQTMEEVLYMADSPSARRYDAVGLLSTYGSIPPPSTSPFTLRLRILTNIGELVAEEALSFTVIEASHYSVDGL
jgi:hypothetical protein